VELKINPTPNLDLEQELFRSGVNLVAGVDEVGRGSLAGPVTVGVAVIDSQVSVIPAKLRDSKLISKLTRQRSWPYLGPGN
jgi:ribonuclease HII